MELTFKRNIFTTKNIFWIIIGTLALAGGICNPLKKPYKATVTYDLENRKISDMVMRVFHDKDDLGPHDATLFRGNDTPYCFTGFEKRTRLYYMDFVRPGDSLIKEPKATTFFVKRRDTVVEFDLSLCGLYFDNNDSK